MRNHTTHPQGRDSHNLNKAGMKNLLIATASQGYDLPAPAKSGAGIGVLVFNEAHNTRPACFLCRIVTPYQWWAVWGRSNPRRVLR
ncbi:TPA: hypothetical protein ACHICU_003248 [Escherichia coli]